MSNKKVLGWDLSGCNVLLFTFWLDYEEATIFYMRYYLVTLLFRDKSQIYLWYPIVLSPQSNNDTMGSRLIDSMAFPHIWLAQENIQHPVGQHHLIPHPWRVGCRMKIDTAGWHKDLVLGEATRCCMVVGVVLLTIPNFDNLCWDEVLLASAIKNKM